MTLTIDAAVSEQVKAARATVGVADLSARGRLRVAGRDRATWLHGMVSNVVAGLAPGQGNYGTILTNRGKMVADYRLIVRRDDLLLDVEPEVPEKAVKWLERYIISEDVTLSDEGESWKVFGVFGPRSSALVKQVAGVEASALEVDCSTAVECGAAEGLVVRRNRTAEVGYDVWVLPSVSSALREALAAAGATPVSEDAVEVLRVEAGIPRYGVDMDDEIIPLEAQLSHAVSFKKGCYLGQEIVARMHYRGHPNKLLVGLRFEGDAVPAPKSELFEDASAEKRVGWVTSATFSPTIEAVIGLGYVRANLAGAGTGLVVRDRDQTGRATVAETPFVSPR